MQRLFQFLTALAASFVSTTASAATVDEQINAVMEPLTNAIMKVIFFTVSFGDGLQVPFVLIWLLFGAIFFKLSTHSMISLRDFSYKAALSSFSASFAR